jgi:lipid-binding SYLF domain-containing protein
MMTFLSLRQELHVCGGSSPRIESERDGIRTLIKEYMKSSSFGFQIGAQSTNFVILFMHKDEPNSLLSDQFTLGGDTSVAIGPVGRQARAAADPNLNVQILSYSRSRRLFAGLELKGVVIKLDKDDMRDVYGEGVMAKEVLKENRITAPVAARAFPNTLGRYSSRLAKK